MIADFQKEEYVVYDSVGVCQIEDICSMKFNFQPVEKMYYILRPQSNQSSTVYVAIDNEKQVSRMRYVMTKDEIEHVLEQTHGSVIDWIDDKKERAEKFREILLEKNQKSMLELASCIYLRKKQLEEIGKRLSTADEQALKEAERFVNDEFAFSLNLSKGEVASYIQKKLDINQP